MDIDRSRYLDVCALISCKSVILKTGLTANAFIKYFVFMVRFHSWIAEQNLAAAYVLIDSRHCFVGTE